MNRTFAPAALLSLAMMAAMPTLAEAATTTAKKPAAKAASGAKKKAAPAKAEPAETTPEVLSEGQMAMASRVFTGKADCEFKQSVDVQPVSAHPGHFQVTFGKQHYDMVPEETTTGAVRLHDRKADVVWLQIPVKSMMMNQKAGQRMVDACQHAEQRAAMEAIEQARVAAAAAETAASAATTAASAAQSVVATPGKAVANSSAAAAATAAAKTATSAAASAAEAASAAASAATTATSVSAPASTSSLRVAPAASGASR